MEHEFNVNWICPKCGVSQPSAEAFGYPCEVSKTSSTAGKAIMTLREYAEMVRDLPLPTDAQKQNFAEYVAHAHSWYKRLPPFPPGGAFNFFLDEYAGCEPARSEGGRTIVKDRIKPGPHYSMIPTAEYRTRFGFLDYRLAGVSPAMLRIDRVSGRSVRRRLPITVLDAGTARLTAVIHTYAGAMFTYKPYVDVASWPEETGGAAMLKKILARCREMEEPGFEWQRGPQPSSSDWDRRPESIYLGFVDLVLHEYLLPERRRQYAEIVRAIDRVCAMVSREQP